MIRVVFTADLLTELLRTGNKIPPTEVDDGIPADAVLIKIEPDEYEPRHYIAFFDDAKPEVVDKDIQLYQHQFAFPEVR